MKCDELKAGSPYCDRNNNMFLYHGDEEQDSELDDEDQVYMKGEVDAAIAELKAKLENVQASAYAESVDAGMENRKLKRALWLSRARDASSFAGLFSTLSYIDDESRTYWIFGNKRKIVIDGLKCSRMETSYKWFCIWDDVANKCLKKAKEYK